ncbi:MAG: hypothetical protein HYY40_05425 [Bacteroidetes bacterium]|nr:hypothetical protein [Bacteroidota bacterium]
MDQFFHRYKYDEDNRIVQVETSSDSVLWDRDARYGYYAHGPLKRMLLGEDKIQGIDYIYTIQGWLKGINNPALMGIGSETGNIAADAFGMTLGYYLGDFNRTGSPYNNLTATSLNGTSLFNGNISSWTSNLDYSIIPYAPNMKYTLLAGDAYQYDELNRIKNSYFHYYDGTGWQLANDEFHTAYTYDPNGNIITLNRKGHGANANAKRLDELDYRYYAGANRLEYIDDNVPQGNWTTDLDDQGAGNYTYDAIGNLTKDVKEKIKQIEWTVYGKVKRIIHFNKNDPTLNFTYDAQGNRVIKELKYPSLCAHSFTSPKPCNPNPNDVKTFYVRDASGNIMAIYEKTEEQNKYKYRLRKYNAWRV